MRVKSCKHLQHAWFNPSLDSPDPTPRQPRDILRELLANTMIGGNLSVDRLFITELFDKADSFRSLPASASPDSFSKFRELPPEIRQAIWLFSIPRRTMHISDVLMEAVCWNRRLPIPAPALACREAWGVIRPRMHAVFDQLGWMWLDEDAEMRRMAWITSSDRLSMGPYHFHAYGSTIKLDDALSTFESVALSLEQLENKYSFGHFDEHLSLSIDLAQTTRVVVQTIVVVISAKPTRYGTIYPLRTRISRNLKASASFLKENEASEWSYENMRGASACDTPTHFVEVVDLHDRRRLNELTTLVMANGGSSWTSRHRMNATCHWDRSYCFDCLMRWWEHDGKGLADTAVTKAYKQLSGIPEDTPVLEDSSNPETEMIPAVKFLIKFPDIDPPGINFADAEKLIGAVPEVCRLGARLPGESDLSSEDI
ncbi:hypothetical protein CGLO_11366 [Colletotrichum gloeosporioides Cg-14]|uniref:2EXR domain-containing protein n=1 Tax=Colletotrichum gloeosporioides (strain Cg-14) TaxID=1237896 RepID=T0K8G9_COLGC|nr:hypothetical protein CGLO_11366 [Colletotrichum gloeosporioides Cg-14]